jgi:signal transduction histidine kinase
MRSVNVAGGRLKEKLTIAGLVAALAILAAIAVASYRSVNGFIEIARWVDHTNEVRVEVEKLSASYYRLRIPWRNFLIGGDPGDLAEFIRESESLPAAVEALKSLTRDNPAQQTRLRALERFLTEDTAALSASVTNKLAGHFADPAAEIVRVTTQELRRHEMDQLIHDVRFHEERLLAERRRQWEAEARQTFMLIVAGNAVGFAILIAVFALLRRENRARRAAQVAVGRLNEELAARAAQLETANRELESFSYSVSHDLRSPLRAVDGFSQMLEEDYAGRLDEEGRRLLAVIRDNSRRMGMLIDDLLAFSRLGRKPVAATEVDMTAMVGEVLKELQAGSDGDLPRCVNGALPPAWGDRALLRQVWANLLSNAVKFTRGQDTPLVEVSGEMRDHENIYCVKDNGAGFDMRYYDKLFGVFQRLHSAEQFPGTGVGLAIVQRVVVKHGGRVWAEGEEGRGAAFYFALPHRGTGERPA